MKNFIASILFGIAVLIIPDDGIAIEYPNKTIQMVVPFDPGSSSDQVGRLLAKLAEPYLGTKIQTVNKPGGSGALGFTYIKDAKPDGYVVGMAIPNLVSHKIYGNLSFDHNDVEFILIFMVDPMLINVSSKTLFHNLSEFIAEAKRRPGELTLAAGGPGSASNIAIRDFMRQAGINIRVVPCGGGGTQAPIMAGGGHVNACISTPSEARAQMEAGNIRPLVSYTDERLSNYPEIPSFTDEGYIARVIVARAIIVPKETPLEIRVKLHDAFKEALDNPEFKEYIENNSSTIFYKGLDEAKKLYDSLKEVFEATAIQAQ